jgi:hypothetical protein
MTDFRYEKNRTVPWPEVHAAAMEILAMLRPHCTRIEIAGSIRRRVKCPGDIEIVAIPEGSGLFGEDPKGDSALSQAVDAMVASGVLRPYTLRGPKTRQFGYRDLRSPKVIYPVDLFISSVDRWGVEMSIRTGPGNFAKALVTEQQYGGRLRDGYRVADGWRLYGPGMKLVPTPEEEDFMAYAGGWWSPAERSLDLPIRHEQRPGDLPSPGGSRPAHA